jgi:hypothetical protein
MSPRYSHVTTDSVVTALAAAGWTYSSGTARMTRKPERARFAAHVLRFRNPSIPKLRDGLIEAVLINSHDGSTAFELGIGAYRLACANGLVIRSSTLGAVRLIHSGLDIERVMEASRRVIDSAPKAAEVIERWREKRLTVLEQIALAQRCARVRWGERLRSIDVSDWLNPQRAEDDSNDLWTSFNRVQERVIRGGAHVGLASHRPGEKDRIARASGVRGAIRQVRLNEEMWQVAEEFAA